MTVADRSIARFLVLDNSVENALKVKVLLGKMQYQSITLSHNPEEALGLIEAKRIQFVIASWELTPMAGTIFVQRVKSKEQHHHIPFVIYSTQIGKQELEFIKHMGIENVLNFPFEESEAMQLIKHVITEEEKLDPAEFRLREAKKLRIDKQYSQAHEVVKPILSTPTFRHRALTLDAQVYYEEEKYPEAEKALEAALADTKGFHPASLLLARTQSKLGKHKAAIELLQNVTLVAPYNVQALINLGVTFGEADQPEEAREAFDQARSTDPTNKAVDVEQGIFEFKQGNFKAAMKFLHEVEDVEQMARDFNNVAVGLVNKNQLDQAIQTYEAALNILKSQKLTAILSYNLGLAWRKKGEPAKAFASLASCLDLDPDYEKAYAALVRLVREMEEKKLPYDRALMIKLRDFYKAKKSS